MVRLNQPTHEHKVIQIQKHSTPPGVKGESSMSSTGIQFLTVSEVAALLKISPRTIYNEVRPGAERKFPIKAKRVGGGRLLRFLKSDVDAYIESL